MTNLVYFLGQKAYINITNACTNTCKFCVRDIKDDVKGANLWLDVQNVKAEDVIKQIKDSAKKVLEGGEIVFCGYGEPLIKFEEVKKICQYIREQMPDLKIRINTNGHGNFVNKKNIVPELKGLIDNISISLNAQNEELYNEISQPKFEGAYDAMLDFARECVRCGIDTTMSIVSKFEEDKYKLDIEKCEQIAHSIGAKFRNREWIKEGY